MRRCDDSEITEARLLFRLMRARTSSEEVTLGASTGREASEVAFSGWRMLPCLELEDESFRVCGERE